jgi:regulator of protease activity HflC (stomatin/prohibitin superfamily)
MNATKLKALAVGLIGLIVIVAGLMTVRIVTIDGNQLGVMETWSNGVVETIMQPKTYFLIPGFTKTVYKYDASSQVFVMNDASSQIETGEGRIKDAYLVQSQEGQDMKISLNLRWRIDPTKLVSIHKTVRDNIEEKIIRPVVMRVVKDESTRRKAIEAYSGEGLVELQSAIQADLSGKGEGKEFAERGIIVENFVIEHIELDPKYIEEIKGKQIATQKALRAAEEEKAAEAEALVAKATAQSDYNKQVVEAERDAKVKVTAAQAAMEQQVLAAKGEQQKLMIEAEGTQKSMESIAIGTLAKGRAEAEAKELMLKAWAVPGADAFVKVEVSKNLGLAFSGIKGYLPEKMTINTFTDNFMKGLDASTGNVIAGPKTTN